MLNVESILVGALILPLPLILSLTTLPIPTPPILLINPIPLLLLPPIILPINRPINRPILPRPSPLVPTTKPSPQCHPHPAASCWGPKSHQRLSLV